MTFPVLMLLAFSMWTIVVLAYGVGSYRVGKVLSGKAQAADFRADDVKGSDRYKRGMRAHVNCIENLPIFCAVIFATYVSGISSEFINALCAMIVLSRMAQSSVHVFLIQTNKIVMLRGSLYALQLISFISIALTIVLANN